MGLCFCCFFCFLQQSDLLTLQCGLVLAKWEGKISIFVVYLYLYFYLYLYLIYTYVYL